MSAGNSGGNVHLDREQLQERITRIFEENFCSRGELGAAVSVWHKGEPLIELHGGHRDARRTQPWESDTIVLVWSATKGVAAACLLHAMQESAITLERPVSELWPKFAQSGKRDTALKQLLSHSAGLCALDTPANVLNRDEVIAAIERQGPAWEPGAAHGYHARTFGFLLDELVRRIAGIPIARYWREVFADPLEIDFWIGLPRELNGRCANIYAARAVNAGEPAEFYRKLAQLGTLQQRTFTSPCGLHSIAEMNKPEMRALSVASFTGIGSASALAKFYAMLANGGELAGRRFFRAKTLGWMTTTLADGVDRVFEVPTAFSAGFMKNATGAPQIFGPSRSAFGHPGAGGSNAFADPENNISFAYVMNQMAQSLFPGERTLLLVDALYGAIHPSP